MRNMLLQNVDSLSASSLCLFVAHSRQASSNIAPIGKGLIPSPLPSLLHSSPMKAVTLVQVKEACTDCEE